MKNGENDARNISPHLLWQRWKELKLPVRKLKTAIAIFWYGFSSGKENHVL